MLVSLRGRFTRVVISISLLLISQFGFAQKKDNTYSPDFVGLSSDRETATLQDIKNSWSPGLPCYRHNMYIMNITVLFKFLNSVPISVSMKTDHFQSISFGNSISIAVRAA